MKTWLITGCSSGLGKGLAEAVLEHGDQAVVTARRTETLRHFTDRYPRTALALPLDVSDDAQAEAAVKAALARFGRVDVLVNNAGITRDGLAARMSDDDFDAVIDINLKGTFHCCRAAAKLMMKQRWGRIVNMSSVVGVYGNAGQVNYAASKAGVIGLTKSLARELARRNITANAVAPGFIATDMTDALSDAQREAIVSRIGSGRLGEPDDIAHLVRFLASDEASYITGQVICVDGGMSL